MFFAFIPEKWEFEPLRASHFSGKTPAEAVELAISGCLERAKP
jgi:hypothetical protein